MNITFIDITTFQDISSEAEHFYAKVARPGYAANMVAFDVGTSFDTCARDYSGIDLRYFPSEEEAKKYAKKDHPDYLKRTIGKEELERRRRWCVEDLIEDGTIRFPSVNDIIKTARNKYPDSLLYFTFHGSHKEFLKRFCFDRKTENVIPEIEKLILGPYQE